MAGAKNALPLSLKHLRFNTTSGFYEAVEDGINYQLTFSQMNLVKTFYHSARGGKATLREWYDSLHSSEKKIVRRSNVRPGGSDEFYPDVEYDD